MSNDSNPEKPKKNKGLNQAITGAVIIFLPLIASVIMSIPNGNPFGEGPLWFMFYSIPIGGLVFIPGVIRFYNDKSSTRRAKRIMTGSLIGCCAGVPAILTIIFLIGMALFSKSHH
jgi:hypothetical protein